MVDTQRWLPFIKEANIQRNCADWELPGFKDTGQRQLCESETCTSCYNKCRGNCSMSCYKFSCCICIKDRNTRLSLMNNDALFFLLISVFHQNLCSLLLPGNQRSQNETLAQCTECSQFVVDYFFGYLTYFAGVLGHRTFDTWRTYTIAAVCILYFGAGIPVSLL